MIERIIFETKTEKNYHNNLFLPTAYDSAPNISPTT